MVPDGWQQTKMGSAFGIRREKGRTGLPILSVTLNDGLIPRHSLERKTDTNLSAEEHLLIKPGDIAYNMMRMWQGASGISSEEAIVSPAYVILKPNQKIDPIFAVYLFKLSRTIHDFWAYSYGLTKDRLRLYYRDFSMVPLNLPPCHEQKRIAEILSTWDRAIETTEKLIASSEVQKKALMQQLLTGKKRLPGFNENWRCVNLREIAQVIVSNVDKKSSSNEQPVRLCNYMDVYNRDRIEADQEFMSSTASLSQIKKFSITIDDVLITKDSERPDDIAVPTVVASTAPDLVCGYHLAIIRPTSSNSGPFIKYLFEEPRVQHYFASRANGATRFGLTLSSIQQAPFRIPSLDEQKAISAVISIAEDETKQLRLDLTRLQSEKSALMQQLLTGKRRVKTKEIVA